jgi:hypothetical protein
MPRRAPEEPLPAGRITGRGWPDRLSGPIGVGPASRHRHLARPGDARPVSCASRVPPRRSARRPAPRRGDGQRLRVRRVAGKRLPARPRRYCRRHDGADVGAVQARPGARVGRHGPRVPGRSREQGGRPRPRHAGRRQGRPRSPAADARVLQAPPARGRRRAPDRPPERRPHLRRRRHRRRRPHLQLPRHGVRGGPDPPLPPRRDGPRSRTALPAHRERDRQGPLRRPRGRRRPQGPEAGECADHAGARRQGDGPRSRPARGRGAAPLAERRLHRLGPLRVAGAVPRQPEDRRARRPPRGRARPLRARHGPPRVRGGRLPDDDAEDPRGAAAALLRAEPSALAVLRGARPRPPRQGPRAAPGLGRGARPRPRRGRERPVVARQGQGDPRRDAASAPARARAARDVAARAGGRGRAPARAVRPGEGRRRTGAPRRRRGGHRQESARGRVRGAARRGRRGRPLPLRQPPAWRRIATTSARRGSRTRSRSTSARAARSSRRSRRSCAARRRRPARSR